MSEAPLNVLAVIGSLHRASVTRIVVLHIVANNFARRLRCGRAGSPGGTLARSTTRTPPRTRPAFAALQARVDRADALLLGTPDYHGSISSAMKNFLDHFWHEFAGKLFATIVASHEKGLTVTDQLRTVARQCYAWTLPYGVSFAEGKM